jgi:signal peptidase
MGNREYESLILLTLILLFHILGYVLVPSLLSSYVYLYILKPLFWLGLSIYIWYKPRCKFKGKLKLSGFLFLWSAICACLYLFIFFAAGFLDGIGASPYTKDLEGIVLNVLSFGSVLVFMEWVRNYLINRVKRNYLVFISAITIIVYSLSRLNLRIISGLTTWQQVVQYLGEYALPEIMSNILLTYMVYLGGAYPAILYSSLVSLPLWISPVLPNLTWITKAFVGIMLPTVFILMIRQIYRKQTGEIKYRNRRKENIASWIAVSIISIVMIWFSLGVFEVFPTVILTGSMEPLLYPGDVALIKKCDAGEVMVGDVIQYWTGEIFIIHRVIAIDEIKGDLRTKGDNNTSPDSRPVTPGQVRGKMIGKIPKLGTFSLFLRPNNMIPWEEVIF